MKLTCIVATYNNESEIEALIESICSNNPLKQDYNLIFCDDSSSDSTVDKIKQKMNEFEVEYELISSDENLRYPGKLINEAIKLSTSDYIHIIDGDDIVLNDGYQFLKQYDDDIIAFDYMRYDHILQRIVAYRRQSLEGWSSFYWNRLIKRELITNNNILMTEDLPLQDCMFMADIFSLKPTIKIVKQPLYIYRTHIKSISTSSNVERIVIGFDHLYNKYKLNNEVKRINSLYKRLLVRYIQVSSSSDACMLVSKLLEMRNYLEQQSMLPEFNECHIEYYVDKIICMENETNFSIFANCYQEACDLFGITDIKHFRTFEISNNLKRLVSTYIIVLYLESINESVSETLFNSIPQDVIICKRSIEDAIAKVYDKFKGYGIKPVTCQVQTESHDFDTTKVNILNSFKNIDGNTIYTLSDNIINDISNISMLMPSINDITVFKNNEYKNGSGIITNHKFYIRKKRLDSVYLCLIPGQVILENNIRNLNQLRKYINNSYCEYIPYGVDLSFIQKLEFKLESAKIKYLKRKV